MIKDTYTISETTHVNAYSKGSDFIGTLQQAKIKATENQLFKGTILKIENETGLVAYNKEGSWYDTIYST